MMRHMEKTFVIAWKSKSGPSLGRGKKLFTREEAESLAKELNEDHPNFIHEPFDLAPAPATRARPVGASSILVLPIEQSMAA